MTTSSVTYRKEIVYSRETHDYAMYLDGELVGFERSYHAAEVTLDQLVFELLSGMYFADLKPAEVQEQIRQTAVETADALAEQAAELSTEAPLWACKACGGEHFIQRCPAIRALLLAPEERVPAFAAPVAEGWGFAGWQEAA